MKRVKGLWGALSHVESVNSMAWHLGDGQRWDEMGTGALETCPQALSLARLGNQSLEDAPNSRPE